LIDTHDKAPIVAALIARTDFVNMQAIFISRIINYQNFAPRFFCRFGVAERPKGKARSLAWEAAEGLTEANPQNDSGLPRPLSQRRPEPARENNDSRYGSLKSPVWSCVSSTLPVSS
jgi:hypothetical protein